VIDSTVPSPAIVLNDVQFSYTKNADKALINIANWQVEQGESVFLFGPSGSGKSTLLNLLAGVLTPQQGEIVLKGEKIHAMSAKQRDRFRSRHIGFVFQQFNLIPYLSVKDNILLASHIAGTSKTLVEQRLEHLFNGLQLDQALLASPAAKLSVGQQQRVAIVRALINQPEIIIADEPTSALDSDARSSFIALLLAQIAQTGATLIFVSHDRSLAQYFSQHVNFDDLNANAGVIHAV